MARSTNKTLLITRPNYDIVTNYFYYWSKQIIEEAQRQGHAVLDISEDRANGKEFTGRVAKMKPELIVVNGHGNGSLIVGHDQRPLLSTTNADVSEGSIVYARACESAQALGPACVRSGAKAYIGYAQPFWLCFDRTSMHRPLEDKRAGYVMIPSNQAILSLVKGNTAGEASQRSKEASRKMMTKLMSSDAPEGASQILSCVWTNMHFQQCLGDASGTI